MNTMKWLLKREFWENRGGLYTAPLIISMVMLVIALLMVGAFTYGLQTGSFEHNGMSHVSLTQMLGTEGKAKAIEGISTVFGIAAAPLVLVMTFVVFFYLIGSLYDDRANRSVLFWKSLPLSDRDTVASKLITALVVTHSVVALFAGLNIAFGIYALHAAEESARKGGGLMGGIGLLPIAWGAGLIILAGFSFWAAYAMRSESKKEPQLAPNVSLAP